MSFIRRGIRLILPILIAATLTTFSLLRVFISLDDMPKSLSTLNNQGPAYDWSSTPKQGAQKPSEIIDVSIWDKPNVSMDDPELISAVRQMLIPLTISKIKFQKFKGLNPSAGQVQLIESILRSFGNNGFFIECGANDGKWYSNTLWVERTLGWKGLLIEADPVVFRKLRNKNRNAWALNLCLASTNVPKQFPFLQNGGVMGRLLLKKKHQNRVPILVQCVPLYTILLAMNRTVVDFFSLDIEGTELDVLRTIPFDKVFIKVLTVEYILIQEGKGALRNFMEGQGYTFFGEFLHPRGLAGDSIFIHSSIQYRENSRNIPMKLLE